VKYFSFFNQKTFCIITLNVLHQSNAGIGKILNIASANDIIHANAKNIVQSPLYNSSFRITIIQTGPEREFNESCLCTLSDEKAFFKTVHNDENVSFHSAQISFNHIHIAL
jgi:hypothetical protein